MEAITRRRQIDYAILRVLLRFLQIVGAMTSLLLLIGTGLSGLTIGAVSVTGFLALLSRILFSRGTHTKLS